MKVNTERKEITQVQDVPVSVTIDIEHFKFLTLVLGNTNGTDRTAQGIEPEFSVSDLYSQMVKINDSLK